MTTHMRAAKAVPSPPSPPYRSWAWFLVLALVVPAVTTSCNTDESGVASGGDAEDMTIVVEADKSRIMNEEQALKQKRDAVKSERDKLAEQRSAIADKLASLSKKDKKQRAQLEAKQKAIETQQQQIMDRAQKVDQERDKLAAQKNALLDRIASLTEKKGGLTIQQREQLVARREHDVAKREAAVAQRERNLATREEAVDKTLAQLNALLASLRAGGGMRTIVVNGGAGGGKVNRIQTVHMQRQVHAKMDAKGILSADLPPTARDLTKTAAKAMAAKDYATAYGALAQLQQIINSITINRDFVQAKFMRLSQAAGHKKLDSKRQKRVQGLLNQVSESFNDGRYDRANRKANQIAALLQGR